MVEYSCEKCGKTFKQKGHYMKHLQRKTPCDNITDKFSMKMNESFKIYQDEIFDDQIKNTLEELLKKYNSDQKIYIICINKI